jgi:hypothetical protein
MASLIRIAVEIEMTPSTMTSPKLVETIALSIFLIIIYFITTRRLIRHQEAAKCLQNGIGHTSQVGNVDHHATSQPKRVAWPSIFSDITFSRNAFSESQIK